MPKNAAADDINEVVSLENATLSFFAGCFGVAVTLFSTGLGLWGVLTANQRAGGVSAVISLSMAVAYFGWAWLRASRLRKRCINALYRRGGLDALEEVLCQASDNRLDHHVH